jgi:hypothetical protein
MAEDVADMFLDLRLKLGHLRLEEDVEIIEIGLHRFIHFGKTGSGDLVGFRL